MAVEDKNNLGSWRRWDYTMVLPIMILEWVNSRMSGFYRLQGVEGEKVRA